MLLSIKTELINKSMWKTFEVLSSVKKTGLRLISKHGIYKDKILSECLDKISFYRNKKMIN